MSSALQSAVCRVVATSAVAIGFAACSTPTTITKEWRDPSYAAGPMTHLLVVGARVDAAQRRTLEDGFTAALSTHGVRATPSYTLFPDRLPDSAEASAAVHKRGFDGVLVSVLRGIQEETFIEVRAVPSSGFFDGYWGPGWAEPLPPPQTDEDVKFETTLWDPRGRGKLVWSAVTETANPSSGREFVSSLLKTIEPALTQAGLIPQVSGPRVSYSR